MPNTKQYLSRQCRGSYHNPEKIRRIPWGDDCTTTVCDSCGCTTRDPTPTGAGRRKHFQKES